MQNALASRLQRYRTIEVPVVVAGVHVVVSLVLLADGLVQVAIEGELTDGPFCDIQIDNQIVVRYGRIKH